MYWTLENRPPTVEEILKQGADRVRAAVESVIDRYDAPKLEIKTTEEYGDDQNDPRSSLASWQNFMMAQMAAQQNMNTVRFGINSSGQQVGFGGYNAFTGYGNGSLSGMGQMFGGTL